MSTPAPHRIVRRAFGLGQALLLCGTWTAAAMAAEPAHPNLSGFWMLASGAPVEDPALKAKISPGTVILKDTGAVEFPLMEFGGLKLTPAAEAAAKSWDSKDDMSVMPSSAVSNACVVLAYCGQATRWPLEARNLRLPISSNAADW